MKIIKKTIQRLLLRRALLAGIMVCWRLMAWAQPEFSIQAPDLSSGIADFKVIANPADTDLSRYDFMWIFEDGFHEFGPKINHKFDYGNSLGDVVPVALYASKRYEMDDDPGERVVSNISIEEIGPKLQSPKMRLSRDPRGDFESIFQFTMGNKYPLMVIVTIHPSMTFNDIAGGNTDCTRQYGTFEPQVGNYKLEEKEHSEVDVPNKKLFFIANENNNSTGPRRADIMLPLCTDPSVELGEDLYVVVEVHEVRSNATSQMVDSLNSLTQYAPNLSTIWGSAAPFWTDTLYRLAVSSWDPNSKAAEAKTDSTVCENGVIIYEIQYENVGDAVEPLVEIFDRLPDFLNPAIWDIKSDRPIKNIDFDADPYTLKWKVEQLFPGEEGSISFKANVKPGTPIGTLIENNAVISFVAAGQDSVTNTTIIKVVDCQEVEGIDCSKCSKDDCAKTDCPKNWRWWLSLMFLLALLFLILWIRAMRRP